MIKILVEQVTPRIEYVFDFIFTQRNVEFSLVTDEGRISGISFAYLLEKHAELPTVLMSEFMLGEEVCLIPLDFGEYQGMECLSFSGATDIIGSIFFVLSRYEEYTTKEKDAHSRFPFTQSFTGKKWGRQAICDRWAEHLLNLLNIPFEKPSAVKIVPTFDIDNTYAYLLKDGKRKWMSMSKDLAKLDFSRIKERKSVLTGKSKDPYDTFGMIEEIADRFPETKLFWLVGEWAQKDRNISILNEAHQQLIKELALKSSVGLHPSYASFLKKDVIAVEKTNLEKATRKLFKHSRQHFLRFSIPETFRMLSEIGFTDEYSMGFAEVPGFRCGTARPHFWFDVERNEVTDLRIHPFVYMDGTLREYMEVTPAESKAIIDELYLEVSRFGGEFIFIWHNETIGDYGNWKGWKSVLNYTLNLGNE